MSQINPYAPPQVPQPQVPPQHSPMQPPPGTEQFAPCPWCGNVFASRIGFTLWGGALGPRLFTHVKCSRCGKAYNGKTGKSNAAAIAIYVVVTCVVGVAVGIALAVAGLFG